MRLENLSPASRALLMQALPGGHLINVLYENGARVDVGFDRERRCFALGERGWLDFAGWEGAQPPGPACASRWKLTDQAQAILRA